MKLQEAARELYLEHGWKMPRGFVKSEERDPRNFTLAEWQQAKRVGKTAQQIKADFQDSWAISDSRAAFAQALKSRGYWLARGDRRGFVAIDLKGEPYAIARWVGIKTKQVRARLGDGNDLPTIEQSKAQIAQDMIPALDKMKTAETAQAGERHTVLEQRRKVMVERQRSERKSFAEMLAQRQLDEARGRQSRFRKGLRGLWDRLRGEHGRIRKQNECEAGEGLLRDRAERDAFVFRQLGQRRGLNSLMSQARERYVERSRELEKDIATYKTPKADPLRGERDERLKPFTRERQTQDVEKEPQSRGRDRSFER